MDIANLVPIIAAQFGVAPSTLLAIVLFITTIANALSRLIPDNATGALGMVRKVCSIVGVHVASRVDSGVTVNDVAKAALLTPPITQKVEMVQAEGMSEDAAREIVRREVPGVFGSTVAYNDLGGARTTRTLKDRP